MHLNSADEVRQRDKGKMELLPIGLPFRSPVACLQAVDVVAAKHVSDAILKERGVARYGPGDQNDGVWDGKERAIPPSPRSSDFHPSNMVTEIQITACKQARSSNFLRVGFMESSGCIFYDPFEVTGTRLWSACSADANIISGRLLKKYFTSCRAIQFKPRQFPSSTWSCIRLASGQITSDSLLSFTAARNN